MNLSGDAVITSEDPVSVEFDFIPSDIKTRNISIVSDEQVVDIFDYVINKMSSLPMHRGGSLPVLACIGDTGQVVDSSILWGCDVMYTDKQVIPRVLSGPLFYSTSKHKDPGRYCDSRVLIPWALDIKVKNPEHNITMITGSDLSSYSEDMSANGIDILSNHTPIMEQLNAISSSRLVLTDSLSALIFAEVLGIPTFPFIRKTDTRIKFKNYYMGTGRDINNIEFLDFSSKIVIAKLPKEHTFVHDIDFLLDNVPFECNESTLLEIKGYYNEIQKYK